MIFVDSNIPMYLVGKPHANKEKALKTIEKLLRNRSKLVTNTEVFQEILHRYSAIDRKEFIQPTFELMKQLIEQIFPISIGEIEVAKELLMQSMNLSSRDCIHIAFMRSQEITTIFTFDTGFDSVKGVERIPS